MNAIAQPTEFVDRRPHGGAEILCCDGVFIKQMLLPRRGDAIPAHSHKYAHHTLIARGRARVWGDSRDLGEYAEGEAVYIAAGVQHLFLALEDNTLAYCIHNLHGADAVEILAENTLGA